MIVPRTIPVILLKDGGCYKTVRFKKPKYIGDPINIIKLFNDLEVDEVIILDISKKGPDYTVLADLATEAFMPLTYGGGISSIDSATKIFNLGFEKVSLNNNVFNEGLVSSLISKYGSQSIIASFDFKRTFFNRVQYQGGNKKMTLESLIDYALQQGFGEILIQSISNEGAFTGPNLDILKLVKELNIEIPIVYTGGVSSYDDLNEVICHGFDAVACGSFFSFKNNNVDSILINYPSRNELKAMYGAV